MRAVVCAAENEITFKEGAKPMLQTVEVVVDVNGVVRLLEPLTLNQPTRALLTLLQNGEGPATTVEQGNAAQLLELLNSPEFVNGPSYSAEEIEAQIQENREAWE
jgi:hypothetical protein